jgi:Undecaprenyl-phosphate galactose phosphotransferase WbaP
MELFLDPIHDVITRHRPRGSVAGSVAAESKAPARGGLATSGRIRAAYIATRLTFVAADTAGLMAAIVLHVYITRAVGLSAPLSHTTRLAFLFASIMVLAGFYRAVAVHPASEIRRLVLAMLCVSAGAGAAAIALGDTRAFWSLILFGLQAGITLPAARLVSRLAWSRAGWWGVPALVVATPSVAPAVIDTLRRWPELGLRPVGLLLEGAEDQPDSEVESETVAKDVPDLPVWGQPERGPLFARAYEVPFAVVALPEWSQKALAQELNRFTRFFERVLVMDCKPGARALWTVLPAPEGLLGYCVGGAGGRGYAIAKRAFDVIGTIILLTVLSPILAGIALIVRLDSHGPALFRQMRMGAGGRCFHVVKFRTMHHDAEQRLAILLEAHPELEREYRDFHKLAADPRITRVGAFLRRFSLDELPQLWNVLRGQMSLVGPRAYLPREIRDMEGLERVVLRVRPGLTGLWQVSGRNALNFSSRVEVDMHYVQNASPWLDLYVLARTVPVALMGEGAS